MLNSLLTVKCIASMLNSYDQEEKWSYFSHWKREDDDLQQSGNGRGQEERRGEVGFQIYLEIKTDGT